MTEPLQIVKWKKKAMLPPGTWMKGMTSWASAITNAARMKSLAK
jgi:hypothetical protein